VTDTDARLPAWLCVLPVVTHKQGEAQILSNLDITRRQAMDRYSQHVAHCSECKAALSKTQATANVAAITAVASLVAACLVASIRATAALNPAAVPSWLSSVVSAGAPAVLGLTGPLVVLGLAAAAVCFLAKKLEGLFYFREFERPVF
jgi:anti-sigma factor RsiW